MKVFFYSCFLSKLIIYLKLYIVSFDSFGLYSSKSSMLMKYSWICDSFISSKGMVWRMSLNYMKKKLLTYYIEKFSLFIIKIVSSRWSKICLNLLFSFPLLNIYLIIFGICRPKTYGNVNMKT